MSGHGHSHGEGGCNSGAEHVHDDAELGVQYSLYQRIDLERLIVYNEHCEGAGKQIFKAWENRLNRDEYVDSDVDEDLFFVIPFGGTVKLKAVLLYGGDADTHPSAMKLFNNANLMSLSDCEGAVGDQSFELARQQGDAVEYPLKPTKFSSVSSLGIYFPGNFGADSTRIYYLGFRGEFLGATREKIVTAVYEARAIPQDHKGELKDMMRHDVC